MYDDLNLYIDGEWCEASDKGTKPVTDPATEDKLATIASATETDIDAALQAAKRGFQVWRKMGQGTCQHPAPLVRSYDGKRR